VSVLTGGVRMKRIFKPTLILFSVFLIFSETASGQSRRYKKELRWHQFEIIEAKSKLWELENKKHKMVYSYRQAVKAEGQVYAARFEMAMRYLNAAEWALLRSPFEGDVALKHSSGFYTAIKETLEPKKPTQLLRPLSYKRCWKNTRQSLWFFLGNTSRFVLGSVMSNSTLGGYQTYRKVLPYSDAAMMAYPVIAAIRDFLKCKEVDASAGFVPIKIENTPGMDGLIYYSENMASSIKKGTVVPLFEISDLVLNPKLRNEQFAELLVTNFSQLSHRSDWLKKRFGSRKKYNNSGLKETFKSNEVEKLGKSLGRYALAIYKYEDKTEIEKIQREIVSLYDVLPKQDVFKWENSKELRPFWVAFKWSIESLRERAFPNNPWKKNPWGSKPKPGNSSSNPVKKKNWP
jgi:hypothetical protein